MRPIKFLMTLVAVLACTTTLVAQDDDYPAEQEDSLGAKLAQFGKSILGEPTQRSRPPAAHRHHQNPSRAAAQRRPSAPRTAAASQAQGQRPRRQAQSPVRASPPAYQEPARLYAKRRKLPPPPAEEHQPAGEDVAENEDDSASDELTASEPQAEADEPAPLPVITRRARPSAANPPIAEGESADATERVARAERATATPTRQMEQVLFTRQTPTLSVETLGPRKVVVGQPATYRVVLKNVGELPASNVNVTATVPDWAQIQSGRTSDPSQRVTQESKSWSWAIENVGPRSQHELILEVVTRQQQPFELEVGYSCAAVASKTTVEVESPAVAIAIAGPKEVVCGEKNLYRLTFTNPGNGTAQNLVVTLQPITPGDPPASHRLGDLSAGASKDVEIELIARQGGTVAIDVQATGDHGVQAHLVEDINVLKAGLELAVSGTKAQYAGAAVSYEIKLANRGQAAAKNVRVMATLPAELGYVSASGISSSASIDREVTWEVGQLAEGEERSLTLKCQAAKGGEGRLQVSATADGDLHETAVANTRVMAVADLAIEVTDPPAPVAVGQEATFEVRVINRGTMEAKNINVTAFFSNGIEPVSMTGGTVELNPGAAVLETISELPAGSELVYKIQAKAETAGNHRIRVELDCRSLDVKLTQEETTLFFDDSELGQ